MTESTEEALNTLLPPHLSDLERELDSALSRIEQVHIPISTLWDPFLCPIDTLPYLAWAMSVDQWQSDWPETIKRQVVAESLSVHRLKGTRPAVEQALAALGIDVEIKEWFEQEPKAKPGTFKLTAWINENLTQGEANFLNEKMYQQVHAAVKNAKNTRSHFDFTVGAKFKSEDIGVASNISGVAALAVIDSTATQEPLLNAKSIGTATTFNAVGHTKQTAQAVIDAKPKPNSITTASAIRGFAVLHQKMEAII